MKIFLSFYKYLKIEGILLWIFVNELFSIQSVDNDFFIGRFMGSVSYIEKKEFYVCSLSQFKLWKR